MNTSIRPATPADAPMIGRAIVMAVGLEITASVGQPEQVEAMFSYLASRDDTQYSWRNTLVAVDGDKVVGVAVAYDGADLERLRRPFFTEVAKRFGKDMTDIADETDPTEVYLDTLAVDPDYRRRGIGSDLIEATYRRARAIGKPLGLLVDKENDRARRLYNSAGLQAVGEREFAYVMMDHLQRR
jgi:ribosomal protein S18 acetylase RimI-like enzyme